jgi:hypothetical protein
VPRQGFFANTLPLQGTLSGLLDKLDPSGLEFRERVDTRFGGRHRRCDRRQELQLQAFSPIVALYHLHVSPTDKSPDSSAHVGAVFFCAYTSS